MLLLYPYPNPNPNLTSCTLLCFASFCCVVCSSSALFCHTYPTLSPQPPPQFPHLKVAHLDVLSGFGELATLTGVARGATVRADVSTLHGPEAAVEILVLPKAPLIDCLQARGSDVRSGSSEAIDYLRQSGLATRCDRYCSVVLCIAILSYLIHRT
jgi:hypothetical protein